MEALLVQRWVVQVVYEMHISVGRIFQLKKVNKSSKKKLSLENYKLTLLHKNLMMQIGHTAALRIRVVAIRMHRIEPNRVIDELVPISVLIDLVRHIQRAILRRRQILMLLLLKR